MWKIVHWCISICKDSCLIVLIRNINTTNAQFRGRTKMVQTEQQGIPKLQYLLLNRNESHVVKIFWSSNQNSIFEHFNCPYSFCYLVEKLLLNLALIRLTTDAHTCGWLFYVLLYAKLWEENFYATEAWNPQGQFYYQNVFPTFSSPILECKYIVVFNFNFIC